MNEYQSMEINSGASVTYYYQEQITKNGKIFPLYNPHDKYYQLQYPYNYSGFTPLPSSVIDVGHIAMIDSEDISEYKEVYDKLYGKEIELDGSYFDMISNSKKLQAKCTFSVSEGSATINGSVTSTCDSVFTLIIPGARCPWMGAVNRDRTSKVSQLNVTARAYEGNSGVYGATKNFRQEFYEGEIAYDEGDVFFGMWQFQFGNPRSLLLPEMHIYFSLYDYKPPEGDTTDYGNSEKRSVTDSFSSQKVGNVSLNATASSNSSRSGEATFGLSIFIGYIVVTPTKIYAWVAVGGNGEYRDPVFSRVPLDQIPQDMVIAGGWPVSDYEGIGQSSITFLGQNLTLYVIRRKGNADYPATNTLSLTGTYTIQKVEDY